MGSQGRRSVFGDHRQDVLLAYSLVHFAFDTIKDHVSFEVEQRLECYVEGVLFRGIGIVDPASRKVQEVTRLYSEPLGQGFIWLPVDRRVAALNWQPVGEWRMQGPVLASFQLQEEPGLTVEMRSQAVSAGRCMECVRLYVAPHGIRQPLSESRHLPGVQLEAGEDDRCALLAVGSQRLRVDEVVVLNSAHVLGFTAEQFCGHGPALVDDGDET
ncbi:hypothetical protein H340_03354 [Streptomyces mobaraensis NBRC 13819 = DSM 40847]|uniref:Uncharacterized protein n=1 Tax=Streptomyces mobaraensis (strain ATCC 29032 / DSM 40847 / JCM 4168 / NBRC 13819 / NCIMB 11159 / IPCR 16-22) TaxID=1223523 RepID=M3CDG0_STRM1|nr:hypothetical protein H340_03354 [Streptomyces mobaraensis NBRC 13819 = DSM 40847]